MQRHHSIVARAAIVGLGLLILLGVGARAQALAAPPAQQPGHEVKLGEYWIGVAVQHPLPEQVRAQLPIPKDDGILVEEVVPSAPADGKLQRYDVIVKAGDKTLKSAADLVAAVDAAKGAKLPLEILRGGKTLRIEVTPVKRPPQGDRDVPSTILEANRNMDKQAVAEALKFLRGEGPPLRFYSMRPGWILRSGAPLEAPLPANLSISVTKQGDQPAKIIVKRDDKTWEITEKELDKLPKDICTHVERMLGRGSDSFTTHDRDRKLEIEIRGLQLLPPSGLKAHKPEAAPPTGSNAPNPQVKELLDEIRQQRTEREKAFRDALRVQRQVDEVQQQLDQLRKRTDELLRAQQAAPKAEKK